jgi:predicted DNA-binding WGR domain protein
MAAECATAFPPYACYLVDVMPDLFGDWTVLRQWGRRGSPGTVRLDSYRRRDEAEIAQRRTIRRRLQHGYKGSSIKGG